MNEPEFNISLGGGLYMDSNGNVHRGAFPTAPTYPLPGGGPLPITRESFEKALTGTTKVLQGIVKVLPDPWDPKKDPDGTAWSAQDSVKRLFDLGVSSNFINLLGTFGGVAAKFAKVIPIVGAVVVILEEFFKLFSPSGPSPLELMIKAQFAAVHTHIRALEMQGKLTFIGGKRVDISTAMTSLNEYLEEITKFQPSLAELQRARASILEAKDDTAKAVESLLQYGTWLLSYNQDSFQKVWPWIGGWLHLMPAGSPPPLPQPAPALPAYENRFEHGMMVPAVAHAVQSYLILIKALAPEYRSTGAYDVELRKFAVFLENLTNTMRAETLARTIYSESALSQRFMLDLWPEDVIDLGVLPPVIAPTCAKFPVGALDLCTHTDAYFLQQFQAAVAAGADPYYGPAATGGMNIRWIPPAKLEKILPPPPSPLPETVPTPRPEIRYRITNPAECAAAANAQSEVDYANLLLSSGYLESSADDDADAPPGDGAGSQRDREGRRHPASESADGDRRDGEERGHRLYRGDRIQRPP